MKVIITTVGTSSLEKANISTENFKGKDYNFFTNFQGDLVKKKNDLLRYFNAYQLGNTVLKNFTAEIKSLIKIGCDSNTLNYLFLSDTAECRLCGEFLKEYIEGKFNAQCELVRIVGLRVDNLNLFQKEGMVNLVKHIQGIDAQHYGTKILNITGGYKATIPYLAILGQLLHIPLYYVFEETNELIQIPTIPMMFDWGIFAKHPKAIQNLDAGICGGWENYKRKENIGDELNNLIWEDVRGDMAELNSIGKMLYQEYKKWVFVHVLQGTPIFKGNNPKILKESISMLHRDLEAFIKNNDDLQNADSGLLLETLRNRGGDNLRHYSYPNTEALVYKCPRTDPEVRLLYGVSCSRGLISELKIYDSQIGSFNHETYLPQWETFLRNSRDASFVPILQSKI